MTKSLEDVQINVKIKLAALWAILLFYIYITLETPLDSELAVLGAAMLMMIPSFMVFLSLALQANANRWTNIILGSIFTGVNISYFIEPHASWRFFAIVEVLLTILIVWYAWQWPKPED